MAVLTAEKQAVVDYSDRAREADAAAGMIEPESIPPVEVAEEPESKPEGEPE